MTTKHNTAPITLDWILYKPGMRITKYIVVSIEKTGIWMVDYIKVLKI